MLIVSILVPYLFFIYSDNQFVSVGGWLKEIGERVVVEISGRRWCELTIEL